MTPSLLTLLLAVAPVADLPFDDRFALVFVEVTVGGSEPLSFMVDTGFDVSVIDAGVAGRLGLAPRETRKEAQPGGDVETGQLAPLTLRLGTAEIRDVSPITVPLAGLSPFAGRRLDGIVGHDVLSRYVVDLDYPRRRLRLLEAEGYRHSGPGQVLPMRIEESQIFVDAGVAMPWGRTVFGSFKIDTGSVDVAGLNLNFVRDGGLISPDTREVAAQGVAVGGSTEGRLFRAAAFVLGADRVPHPLLGYTVDSRGFENRPNAGTIGGATLSRYRVILDYPARLMILEGPTRPEAPAPENRAGMLVVGNGPDYTSLVVTQVVPGSAADEAGIETGDEIAAMGGRRDWDLVAARRMLEEDGPLDLTIRHEGELRNVSLRRRAILPVE